MAFLYALIRKIPPTLVLAVRCHTRVTPQSPVRFFPAMPRAPFRRTESWWCGQSKESSELGFGKSFCPCCAG
jgi:hypothetical protein